MSPDINVGPPRAHMRPTHVVMHMQTCIYTIDSRRPHTHEESNVITHSCLLEVASHRPKESFLLKVHAVGRGNEWIRVEQKLERTSQSPSGESGKGQSSVSLHLMGGW